MASVFWDAEGIIMIDYLEKGASITGSYHAEQIKKMREAIKENRRGKLRAKVLSHPDHAPSHKAEVTLDALREAVLNCEVMAALQPFFEEQEKIFFNGIQALEKR
ncbi:unnamed protein product [Euphydryas editha]|uniref:Transposase n=1 Tax=Euphydryas editha TaxID=104508 RepID=A0AAU9TX87_EUPED|nr:unnamed protein product [Euphydryas editha]